ncbi:hypothetical protein MSG28_000611 [Choristoneura fumiferana]|uniref:Uncharacterized protein n=1 Tax=Choristoneura fumiferana TaxID=7141 RepID=A0ACC0K1F2_CHOFU|nr:hypothetical protein MSG28_000611 [Choristoneura fumiferana]
MWDWQFMEHIATETNKYAQQLAAQLMLSNNLHRQSRICDWQDTSSDELYVYMAINVAMGVVTKGRVSDYWNADETIFLTPRFRVYMSLRSFSLHFRDNRDMYTLNLSHSEAKLYKIQPVVDHLNNAFQSLYNLQQNIALDESLLQWKGLLEINQFIPNKAAVVGIKTYEICEPQTGSLWRFVVHAHKRTTTAASNTDPLQTFIPNIVLTLLQGLENKALLEGPRAVYTVREHYLKEYDFDPKLKGRKRRKPYSVIIFSFENVEYISASLRNWLNEDKKTCLWPNKKKIERKAININMTPEADWITLKDIRIIGHYANLKEVMAVEKCRQAASSSSEAETDNRKITKNKKYRDDSLSPPPPLSMKPIEELNEIHTVVDINLSSPRGTNLCPNSFDPVILGDDRLRAIYILPGHHGGATSRRHQQNVCSSMKGISPGHLVAQLIWQRNQHSRVRVHGT